MRSYFDVTDYGAVGNKSDSTAPVQKAIDDCLSNGGGVVFFPAGTYGLQAISIRSGVSLQGVGRNTSILTALLPDQDLLRVGGPYVNIRDLGFSTQVKRIAGSYISFGSYAYECLLDSFHMKGAYVGITLSGPTALYVEHGSIRDMSTAPGSCGILVDGGNDHFIRCVEMDNPADQQPLAGIYVKETGALNITDCSIIHCGNDLLITGGYCVYALNSYFDTALCGVRILAQNPVQRCHFIGCWTSSHQEHGFLIEPGSTAVVEDIDIIGHQSFFNGFSGIYLGKGNHVKIEGSSIRHNGMAGIRLAGSDYVILIGNDTTENTATGIVETPPSHVLIANNF